MVGREVSFSIKKGHFNPGMEALRLENISWSNISGKQVLKDISFFAAFAMYYLIWRTPYGFQIRTIGSNPNAAAYAGMSVVSGTTLAVIMSGGLAGLGGAVELMGSQHRLMHGFSPGYAFDAIGAAVMGRHNPWGIVITSFLFAVLRVGAGAMQRGMGVPLPLVWVIQGLIIILVIASSYLTTKLSSAVVGGRA
ncbi:MAG: hypothetical protein AB1420_02925 [Bacillota bacterium]